MAQKGDENDSTEDISRQAAVWWLRLNDERRLSIVEGRQFLQWMTRSPRHVYEFLLIRRQDSLLKRLSRAHRSRSNVTHVNWWRGSSLQQPEAEAGQRRSRRWNIAAAALVMLSVVVALGWHGEQSSNRTVTTVTNESKTQRLQDGSVVSLQSDSTLRIEFKDQRREVHLVEGKATFDVVMDMKRPFVVNTYLVDIAAVESKFAVTIDTSVEVEVFEGVVAVSGRKARAGAPVVTVKKGERYRVPVDGGLRVVVAEGEGVLVQDGRARPKV